MSRRRFVWNKEAGRLVEVTPDWTPTPRTEVMSGSFYEGARTLEGEDIGSRRKHAEHMRRNGLAPASDFRDYWAKAAKERETALSPNWDKKGRREDVGRAMHLVQAGKGRRNGR